MAGVVRRAVVYMEGEEMFRRKVGKAGKALKEVGHSGFPFPFGRRHLVELWGCD